MIADSIKSNIIDKARNLAENDEEVVLEAETEAPAKMKWTDAVAKARKDLGVEGFSAIKKGTPLYDKAKSYMN